MKFQTKIDTPDIIATVLQTIQEHAAVASVTDQHIVIEFEVEDAYDLGFTVREIQDDLVTNADIYVEIPKPTPVEEKGELTVAKADDLSAAVGIVNGLQAKDKEEAEELVKGLKTLHSDIEDKLRRLAIDHQLYVSLGSYGYGRSIDGHDYYGWNDSGCEWETSAPEPQWRSSSEMC